MKLFVSVRNLLLFRSPRPVSNRLLTELAHCSDLTEARRKTTEIMLDSLGLTLSDTPDALRGIWLTSTQQRVVRLAEQWGYYCRMRPR